MHGCHVEARAEVERVQWWAEALHRYEAGGRANLLRNLFLLAADRAEAHRGRDSAEEEIRNALHDLGGGVHDQRPARRVARGEPSTVGQSAQQANANAPVRRPEKYRAWESPAVE